MKRALTFIIKHLLPGHSLELSSYVSGVKKNLRKANEQVEDLKIVIGNLESFHLPKNFEKAVEQINLLTPKARATFFHTLATKVTSEDGSIETLQKYIYTRTKEELLNEEHNT